MKRNARARARGGGEGRKMRNKLIKGDG